MSTPLESMTGYGRAEGSDGRTTWVWDIRSVNGRSQDVRLRMPNGFEALDPEIRAKIKKAVGRGNISVTLSVKSAEQKSTLRFNMDALDEVLALQSALGDKVDQAPPRLDVLLTVRGVAEAPDEAEDDAVIEARKKAVLESFEAALAAFADARQQEGQALLGVLNGLLEQVEGDVAAAKGLAATAPEALFSRLKTQLDALVEPGQELSAERLHQEAAILATKADVREELDRLVAHVASARVMLTGGGQIGRKLDFLCQELNREANTLCSKSSDIELTRIGLSLKTVIDQFKEQVQNVA
ncbi:MAG: YicC family protein [Alphaproteobacteria bacterium]|nr:YicC family protein [Alphaproteobacteria bacterium]